MNNVTPIKRLVRGTEGIDQTPTVLTNKPQLDQTLVTEFESKFGSVRKNIFEICRMAYDLRLTYTDDNGNYVPAFKDWYKGIERLFGKLPNFTKYAEAGRLISTVERGWSGKESKLPTTMSALYEVAQLADDELRLCFETNYSRTSVTAPESEWTKPKKPKPVITPMASASAIRTWRKNWRNPPVPTTEKRTIPLLTLFVHESLLTFGKKGSNAPEDLDMETVKNAHTKLIELVEGLGIEQFLRVETRVDELEDKYDRLSEKATARASKKKSKKKGR